MKIYTNLNPKSVIFLNLYSLLIDSKISLHYGLTEIELKQDKVIFWFAKSNAGKLHYYRVTESIESIYNGLKVIENHKELIK